jgi:hypothetical protein
VPPFFRKACTPSRTGDIIRPGGACFDYEVESLVIGADLPVGAQR